jgi:hypothetical protein
VAMVTPWRSTGWNASTAASVSPVIIRPQGTKARTWGHRHTPMPTNEPIP